MPGSGGSSVASNPVSLASSTRRAAVSTATVVVIAFRSLSLRPAASEAEEDREPLRRQALEQRMRAGRNGYPHRHTGASALTRLAQPCDAREAPDLFLQRGGL